MKYMQVYDNVPYTIDPKREIDTNACCDCGLVHDIYYEIKNHKVVVMKRVNRRSTAQMRRWMKKKQRGYIIFRDTKK